MAKTKKDKFTSIKPETSEEKKKVLQEALAKIEKDFGKGAVMKLGDQTAIEVNTIPTGCLTLDMALGVGGIPKSRIVEIYGAESSGKTTLALHAVAEVQKMGGIAGYIDAEHALDPVYAKKIGVDIDNLYVSQPDNGEQAFEIAETMVRSGAIDLIVIDSVAALVPKVEIEGTMEELQVGLHARMMSKGLRKLTGLIGKSDCAVIFINQLRDKIGVTYGNPEVTTGGRALKFYSSVRLEVRRGDYIRDGGSKEGKILGAVTKIKVVKNKVAPPFKQIEAHLMYGEGFSHEQCLVELGVELDIIKKAGSWYSYNGEKLGQGVENVKKLLQENVSLAEELESKIREANHKQLFPFENEEVVEEDNVLEDVELDSIDLEELDFDEVLD